MIFSEKLRNNLRKRTFFLSAILTSLVYLGLPKNLSLQETKGLYPVIGTMLCILNGIVLPMVMAKFTISQSETRKAAAGEYLEVSNIITHIEHTFSRMFMCLFVTLYLFLSTYLELGKGSNFIAVLQQLNWIIFSVWIFLLSYSLLMLYQTAPLVIIYARKYINAATKEYQAKKSKHATLQKK